MTIGARSGFFLHVPLDWCSKDKVSTAN